MNKFRLSVVMLTILALGTLPGCSTKTASPDVSDSIRKSLDQAGFREVSVSQDRDKGIVTLGGQVASDNDKSQAESLAKSFAGAQVVADQIAVIPPGLETEAKTVNSDLDEGIEKNLHAALIQNKLDNDVKPAVTNGVVTLTGEVNSQARRTQVETLTSLVPNVKQVVNEVQVKNQKATTTQDTRTPTDKSEAIRTLTGCVQRDRDAHEINLIATDGSVWDLSSDTVKLDPHVGHIVTVTGQVRHAALHGLKEEIKEEAKEHGVTKRATEHGDLTVSNLAMVSVSCLK
jgi:hyperosmotically inducible protein